jgi:hypothetical protein
VSLDFAWPLSWNTVIPVLGRVNECRLVYSEVGGALWDIPKLSRNVSLGHPSDGACPDPTGPRVILGRGEFRLSTRIEGKIFPFSLRKITEMTVDFAGKYLIIIRMRSSQSG